MMDNPQKKINSRAIFAKIANYGPFATAYLASIIALGVHILADINGASLAFNDDIWFQPIVLNFTQTGKLAHPFMSPIAPNEESLLIWHSWLMPMIQGVVQNFLINDSSYAEIKLSAHVLAAVIFTGFSVFFYRSFGPLKASVVLPILLCLFLYQVGRPELVASGILLLYLIIINRKNNYHETFLVATCIALLMVTSPVLAVYILLLTLFFIFSSDISRNDCIRRIACYCLLVPIIALVLTSTLTDLNFWDWLAGIFMHAQRIAGRSDGSFVNYFVLDPQLPGLVAFIVYFLVWIVSLLGGRSSGSILILFALVFFVYYSSIRVPPTIYNFAWLLPLVLYFSFKNVTLNHWSEFRATKSAMLILLCVLFSFSSVISTFYVFTNLRSGRKADDLINAMENLPETAIFAFDRNRQSLSLQALLSTGTNGERVKFVKRPSNIGATHRIEFQARSQNKLPGLKINECVVATNFHRTRFKGFGQELAFAPNDWAFAIISLGGCRQAVTALPTGNGASGGEVKAVATPPATPIVGHGSGQKSVRPIYSVKSSK